jgi:hypothetical protein
MLCIRYIRKLLNSTEQDLKQNLCCGEIIKSNRKSLALPVSCPERALLTRYLQSWAAGIYFNPRTDKLHRRAARAGAFYVSGKDPPVSNPVLGDGDFRGLSDGLLICTGKKK